MTYCITAKHGLPHKWYIALIKSLYWRININVPWMNVRQSNCRNLCLHHHIISFSPIQYIMWDFWLVKLPSNVLLVVMPLNQRCLFFWTYFVGGSTLCWLVLPVVMPLDLVCLFFWIHLVGNCILMLMVYLADIFWT